MRNRRAEILEIRRHAAGIEVYERWLSSGAEPVEVVALCGLLVEAESVKAGVIWGIFFWSQMGWLVGILE